MPTTDPKGKKPRIDSEGDKDIESALLRPIEKLQEIEDELDRVDEEAIAKVLEVEQKYKEIRRQVYVRRNEIIKKIPDFWLTAFLSHPMLGELLTKDDQEIFKHLMSIDVDEPKDIKSGYSITLTFSSNPYFKDTELTKTCSFSDDGKIIIKASSINWKDGMDIANGRAHTKDGDRRLLIDESIRSRRSFLLDSSSSSSDDDELILATLYVAHKQYQLLNAPRHGGSVLSHCNREARIFTSKRKREARILNPTYGLGFFGRSFFTWFNDAKNKTFALGVTDQVADIIKEELWPNPLKYFNNEAEDEFEEDEEESDDDDDGDDDDEDNQDEEEDDEEK